MTYANELVFNLLAFCFQLHVIWERLPLATSAYSEMLAERFKSVCGCLFKLQNEPFHIVLFLFGHLDLDYISRYGELYEQCHAVYMSQGFALSCHGFNEHVVQNDFLFLFSHFQICFFKSNAMVDSLNAKLK